MKLDAYTVLAKWLKKTKLRDGNHKVGLSKISLEFYYRGFPLGKILIDRVELQYPAVMKNVSSWNPKETIFMADVNFFKKLRKAFRGAMTAINAYDIYQRDTGWSDIPRGPGGRQQSATER